MEDKGNRWTDTKRDRQTYGCADEQADRKRDRQTNGGLGGQTGRKRHRQADGGKSTERQKTRYTGRWMSVWIIDRQAEKEIYRWRGYEQTDKKRQTDRYIDRHMNSWQTNR